MTRKLSSIYQDCAKTHANSDPSLRSGQAPTATPHTTGPLAVRQSASKSSLYQDFRRASKSFAAHPCNRPAAKHMLFLPTLTPPFRQLYYTMSTPARLPGLCYLDNFIMSSKIFFSFTGTNKNHIPGR